MIESPESCTMAGRMFKCRAQVIQVKNGPGNLIQAGFVAVLRMLVGRFVWLGPVVDRVGPKALRSRGKRAGGGVAVAIVWFALSWYVGHKALLARSHFVSWMLRR